MPRRSVLNAAERDNPLALPANSDDLIQHYTFSESDLCVIRQHRGAANRLGFAIQLCYMRYPGVILGSEEMPHPALLRLVTAQLKIALREATATWAEYGRREQTRREHLAGLQAAFGFQPFAMRHYRPARSIVWRRSLGKPTKAWCWPRLS